jgi:hypothetical protein
MKQSTITSTELSMTDRKKDLLFLASLLILLVLCFSKILFTDRVIRAPDILNEFYWWVKGMSEARWGDLFSINLASAGWNSLINSGFTNEGGVASLQFLLHLKLIFKLIPAPASVAWCIVLHLFAGAAGVYFLCRAIGAGRFASFLGGAVFALAPENASLINAGHVMKIATIAYAPWAFLLLEKGYQTRRVIFFLSAGFVLAFQFFNTHWQIAFYTCLCIGVYGIVRSLVILREAGEEDGFLLPKLAGLNLAVLIFFLTTSAVSLLPLANWSADTTRGIGSGANMGKGGLAEEEAMSWSLPPEELVTFAVPGFFGLSRQEAGENPGNIAAYYWGRMNFTQTSDYMGLLPWLLLPLPLIFRRDRYTWLAVAGVAGGILFSMGKYTPFYRLLFEYFPGINHFRVPKMMMFIPVLGMALLTARGLDLVLDPEIRDTRAFRRYLWGLLALPLVVSALLAAEILGKSRWMSDYYELFSRPTRYEAGVPLVTARWDNLVLETGIAALMAALYAAVLFLCSRKWLSAGIVPLVLLGLYLGDVGRVNGKFLFLVDVPDKVRGGVTPVMEYLRSHGSAQYRVLPMNGVDPMQYVENNIPVLFTSNPVQQQRWQNFLDAFLFPSPMPDMINLKYLVYDTDRYAQEKANLGDRFLPVYLSPDRGEVVLENRSVLPKAWLVSHAAVIREPGQVLSVLRSPMFDPRLTAIVETPPPVPLDDPQAPPKAAAGSVGVERYEDERITVDARPSRNALLVLGEKYYRGWRAFVDGKPTAIHPVNHILRGVYLTPGAHRIEFVFDPIPFRIGKWLTLLSFCLFAVMLGREVWIRRVKGEQAGVRSQESGIKGTGVRSEG